MAKTANTARVAELRDQLTATEAEIDQAASTYGAAVADGNTEEAAAIAARVAVLDGRAREIQAAIAAAELAEQQATARRAQLEAAAQAETARRAARDRQRERLLRMAVRVDRQVVLAERATETARLVWEAEAGLSFQEAATELAAAMRADGYPVQLAQRLETALSDGASPDALRHLAADIRAAMGEL